MTVGLVVILILALTLFPSSGGAYQRLSREFPLDLHGLADHLLNIVLFLPLGLAIGWNSHRFAAAGLAGVLLSVAIEYAQIFVPGRDPALSDIVFNTAGATLGAFAAARPRSWIFPGKGISGILATAATVGAAAMMTATAFVRPTVGQGWTILPGLENAPQNWAPLLTCAWMLALCAPAGFWSRGRVLLITGIALGMLLLIIPRVIGASTSSDAEWAGMIAGLFTGAALRALAQRYDAGGGV